MLQRLALLLGLPLVASGCYAELSPGQWGVFRYFGEIQGTPPMELLPPASDRDGNIYVLYGSRELQDNEVFVGHVGGGWSGGCRAHRGNDGMRGFVGRTRDRMWFWSGVALVEVDGNTGACRELLSRDPVTGTELSVVGVIPWIDESPTQRTMMVLIQAAGEELPYHVVVDLDERNYRDASIFPSERAQDLKIIGTAADPLRRRGAYLVAYTEDDRRKVEAIYYNSNSYLGSVSLSIQDEPEAYSVLGFGQFSDGTTGAALLEDGRILLFNESEGGTKTVSDFTPSGIQSWDGLLWIRGVQEDGTPVVASLDGGSIGPPAPWESSIQADAFLEQGVRVLDERLSPSAYASWGDSRNAIGQRPFLSPWPLDGYTLDSSLWIIAGPSYSSTLDEMTSIAVGPVGVSFP